MIEILKGRMMTISKKKMALAAGSLSLVALVVGGSAVMAGSWRGHHGGPGMMGGAHMDRMVTEIDANGDGALSQEEIDAYRDARFAAADTDGDGAITPKEMSDAKAAMRFAAMDTDGDGVISQAEFMDVHTGRIRTGKGFHRMDKDGSGRVEAEEFAAMSEHMKSRLDSDGDGMISADELQAMRDHHKN